MCSTSLDAHVHIILRKAREEAKPGAIPEAIVRLQLPEPQSFINPILPPGLIFCSIKCCASW